jgi:LIM domain
MGGPRSRSRNGTVGSRAESVQRPSTANGRRKPSLADITRGPRLIREERPPLPSADSGNTASIAATNLRPAGLLTIKPGSSQAGGLVDLAMRRRPLSPNRSQTFPLHNEDRISGHGSNGFIARRPSEPSQTLPSGRPPAVPDTTSLRSLKGPGFTSRAYSPPDQSVSSETQAGISHPSAPTGDDHRIIPRNRAFHVRNASHTGFRVDLTTSDHPPLPARTDIGVSGTTNISHTSTESASSDASGTSVAQTNSSRSSPPPADKGSAREQSNTTYRDQPRPAPLPDLALPTQHPLLFIPPESPTDPLCQQGRLSPIPRGRTNRSPFSMISSSSASSRASSRNPSSRDLPNGQRKASGSRGPCRGCSQPIIAGEKSISSKDGRLTGRYHKKCFVCHTCQGPFETADFYVHDDRPFCATHYHTLNGSLCSGCGKGIEGQYLEATDTKDKGAEKFHPSCLKCSTCHMSLQDDYFEWMGKVYCERDAKRAADVQLRSPSGLSPRPGPSPMSNLPINASPLGRSGLPSGPRAGLRPPGPGHESGPRNGFLSPFVPNAGPRVPASGGRFPERRTTRLMMI